MDIVYVNSPTSTRMFEKNLIVSILSDSTSTSERENEYSQIQVGLSGIPQEIFSTYYFSAFEDDSIMFSIDLPRLKEDGLITTAANVEFYLDLVSFAPTYATVLSASVWFNTLQYGAMTISTTSDDLIVYTPINVNISYTSGTTSTTTTPSPGTTTTTSSTTRTTTRTTKTTAKPTSPIPTTPARSTSWWPTVTIPPIALSTTTAAPTSVFSVTTTTYTTTPRPTKTTRKPITTFIGTPPPSGVLCPKPGYCKSLNF
jgi:hypothetical protein